LRLLFFILVFANVLFLAYWTVTSDTTATAAARNEELQINPGRIKIVSAASRGPGGAAKAACLEWGPFSAADASRAEASLASLRLAQPPLRSVNSEDASQFVYLLREPNKSTVARIAELQSAFPGTQIKAKGCPG
jgi:hypothetical protein